jgi:ATP-dependent DNA helicase RecG
MESQKVEYKAIWKDEYLKWICGFANASGGKLLIGVDDTGVIVGILDYKKLLDEIPNKILSHLGIICDLNLLKKNKLFYLEIIVRPYDVAISYQGRYYYRSGTTKQELKGRALNEFLLKKTGRTWDDVIELRAAIEDIDPKAIQGFIKAALKSNRLTFTEDENDVTRILENLLLIENNKVKRAGILLFGKTPCRFFIHAYVKIGRFGKTDDELLFQEIVESNVFELAEKTLDILDKKFFISTISYEGVARVERWEYPYKAVREAIINAIVHRDYSGAPIQISVYDDKIMIWNEGKLPEGFTIEDLKKKHSSRPYNPFIAMAFFKGGLIEAWGRGTINIINECLNANLPEPRFASEFGGISVTLFKDKFSEDMLVSAGLNDRQIKTILYVKKNNYITNSIYQKLFEVSERTALRNLETLINLNFFEKTGKLKGTKYILKTDG